MRGGGGEEWGKKRAVREAQRGKVSGEGHRELRVEATYVQTSLLVVLFKRVLQYTTIGYFYYRSILIYQVNRYGGKGEGKGGGGGRQ